MGKAILLFIKRKLEVYQQNLLICKNEIKNKKRIKKLETKKLRK